MMTLYAWEWCDHPEWRPLEQFAAVTVPLHHGELDPDDFMYVAKVVADGHPPIHLYKHIDTRCYFNLDDAGHAYRFIDAVRPRTEHDRDELPLSHYEPWPDARSAIEHVELYLYEHGLFTTRDRIRDAGPHTLHNTPDGAGS